jgi:fatty acid desaturase
VAFPGLPLYANLLIGSIYAVSISWNINGISHNFIHNAYFRGTLLNRAFSLMESMTLGFSQTFYKCVHNKHHIGNSDRPDTNGRTIDWLSIYRHGHEGMPENVWSYTFLSFFRDDPKAIYREIARRSRADANWGVFEIACFLAFFAGMGVMNWRFIVCLLPFWYLGHCLSYLNGYFEHYAGNPDKPIAWGVSTYHKLYNLIWFNNGYHAEHHYRPRTHWTRMRQLHMSIARQQEREGTRVIRPPHALGFLDPDLPPRNRYVPEVVVRAKQESLSSRPTPDQDA